jgi:uroporphyrinogen decarboxylase
LKPREPGCTVTMRDRAIAALRRHAPYPGPVPHYDHLFGPLIASGSRRFHNLNKIADPKEKERARRADAELYVELAERFGWCGVRIHRDPEDEVALARYVKELVGNRLLVEGCIGFTTLHLPEGSDILRVVYEMADRKDEFKERLARQAEAGIELGRRLIDAGADAVDEISDYCYNRGCWLSPAMFREFIFPYLRHVATTLKRAGAYFVCHTDGDVMGILDQLVEAEIDALHSLQEAGQTSMASVKAAVGNRICLIGNVDMGLLVTGPEETIEDSTRRAILQGAPGGSFILSSSNGMTEDIPLSNYMALHRTWRRYGNYSRSGQLVEAAS